MTARERVLASRLIKKIDNNKSYANQIGLNYTVSTAGSHEKRKTVQNNKKDS